MAVAGLVNVALLWHFHDRHWYAPDEGNYAHVAERVLAGEVLHRDVQDLHPGYVNFLNASAFAVFGIDLASLRYPLAAAALVQAMLVWWLIVGRDLVLAVSASVAATALGVLQFLNPTAHWYSLFLTVALIGWLSWLPTSHGARTWGAGALLGLILLFRHLTGIWVAMALVAILLSEASTGARGRNAAIGRAVFGLMTVALVVYLARAGGPEMSGIVLVASWPAALLLAGVHGCGATNRACVRVLSQTGAGALVAFIPLVLYHAGHGSLGAWIDDTVFAAFALTTLPFFEGATYVLMPVAGLLNAMAPSSPTGFVNGLYWVVLALIPILNGILVLRSMRHGRTSVPILPLISVFYSLVTLHFGGPGAVYLFFTVGLAAAGVLWFAAGEARRVRFAATAGTATIVAIAVAFHAGQSPFRRPIEAARGVRTVTMRSAVCPPFERSSLRVEWRDCEPYRLLVQAIEAEAPAGSSIFAIPSDAELYFLTARANPFRFFNTALGLRSEADVADVIERMARHPPQVVTFRPDDKYNTPESHAIMAYVRDNYDRFSVISGVELYRPRGVAGEVGE
jgi:hypothetical protein